MNVSGGRKEDPQKAAQGTPSSTVESDFSPFSSSQLDNSDSKILSLARDCPVTLLRISRRTDIPFVECLRRAVRLERVGLLEKVGEVSEPAKLHLYVATQEQE